MQVTVRRTWMALSPWQKVKLVCGFLWEGLWLDEDEVSNMVEELKQEDKMTEAIKEWGKEFPSFLVTLLEERERFMSRSLRDAAQMAVHLGNAAAQRQHA